MIKKYDTLCQKLNIGKLKSIEKFNSSQNNVYKFTTDKGIYVVKEYTKDAINNYYYLKKRKEQIRISKILAKNGINCSYPISVNKKYFINFKNHYYLVYNYYEEKPLTSNEVSIDHIKILAKTQAKIHLLNIDSNIPCAYKKININFKQHIQKIKKINKDLYTTFENNYSILEEIIDHCNNNINKMKKHLCISHNDYKLLNILWNQNNLTLIDFDATGLSNPTCSLCESAFTFSNYKTYINYDYYKTYLESYINVYGQIEENYRDALYASFNGKLQWLEYVMSKNHLKRNNYMKETIDIINELVLYYNNIDKFNDIYLKLINNNK